VSFGDKLKMLACLVFHLCPFIFNGVVCQVTEQYMIIGLLFMYYFFHFFIFFNTNQHQNILTFFTFYITLIIFYYYSNKKIHYNSKLFHFSIQFFILFYITSSLFTNSNYNNPLFCYVHVFAKQAQPLNSNFFFLDLFTEELK
jgi:hypothetical protein